MLNLAFNYSDNLPLKHMRGLNTAPENAMTREEA